MILLVVVLCLPGYVRTGTAYSSYNDLEALLRIETKLVTLLGEYIVEQSGVENKLLDDLRELRSYVVKYRGEEDALRYLKYPANQFSLIYRFSKIWPRLPELADYFSDLMSYYSECEFEDLLPDEEDITKSATAIHRLQDMYHVTAEHLSRGLALGGVRGQELSVGALYSLLENAHTQERWNECTSWGAQILGVLNNRTTDIFEEQSTLAIKLDECTSKRIITTRNESKPIEYLTKAYPGADHILLSEEELENKTGDTINEEQYRSLCREDHVLPHTVRMHQDLLHCYYKGNTPRSILAPIKIEEAWSSPRILIFHDIISDEESEVILGIARPKLQRSGILRGLDPGIEEGRISKISWIKEGLPEDPQQIVRRINRRLEDATELSLRDAESLQVNNYGIGGLFSPHFDISVALTQYQHSDPRFKMEGTRIATALMYLGEVEAGGATVFVDGGARIAPIKNSAVFWYNLLPNGLPDMTTQHAGCPVLTGNKWVINKWFDSMDQAFIRPCDLEKNRREKDAKLYNGKYSTYDGAIQMKRNKGGY